MFVPGKPFQSSQMFVGKARTYSSEAPFRASILKGWLLALTANIRLGWKSLPGTNAPAYYEMAAVKRFKTLAKGLTRKL